MADGELTVGDHIKQEIQRRVLMADKAHEMGKKYIMVDIDGTICHCPGDPKSMRDQLGFRDAVPYPKRIDFMNGLYDEGHFLHYWTARGCWDGEDYLQETREQLDSWGVKYNDVAVFKPLYDMWIDDKSFKIEFSKAELHLSMSISSMRNKNLPLFRRASRSAIKAEYACPR